MAEQLLLPGMGAPGASPSIDNLFVAVFPGAEDAKRLSNLGIGLKDLLGVQGKLLPEDHLHVTLYHVGTYRDALPDAHVAAAKRACHAAAALSHPFDLSLNQAFTYRGARALPFVLRNTNKDTALHTFQEALVIEFAKQGFRVGKNSSFDPHVTLAYAKEPVPEVSIDPIGWMVNELVLIRSMVGQTKYQILGRWSLAG
ncbi:2'-5' RNA ligase family protein [Luteolibacter sp. GHJ8]|uniref:2'-5' RNA ligase family protein n=1 Tax=Luteolibacter rhizosphaerae TaxID=2989719 RepID=A0ABT3G7C2_9BACT|nr:2'-5' RNA ligase family protein [Luteolibacter rhizosphaerae]MCW1915527.1 2'-5' RNA ligase family protein [Luteolibacter rhizosphaerae]